MYVRIVIVFAVVSAMTVALWAIRKPTPATEGTTLALDQPLLKRPSMPSPIASLAMLRASFLSVDHAVKTGNFTVLRDLGSNRFRKENPAARLTQVFGTLPNQNVDLLATAVVDPLLTKAPEMTPDNMIYMTGLFDIQPRAVAFEILFELEEDEWRIFAIAIAPAAARNN